MAPRQLTEQPIKIRHDYEDEEDLDIAEQSDSDGEQSHSDDFTQSDPDVRSRPYLLAFPHCADRFQDSELSSSEEEPESQSLNDISFGALAKAQESFAPKSRKRKLAESLEESIPHKETEGKEEFFDTGRRAKEARIDAPKRTSKHAPAVESARKPVSRKRTIFEPTPALKFRDPRFDAAVMSTNRDKNAVEKANKNYSFLSTYQAAEILDLKAQIKKAKDPEVVADLKRKAMSLESKVRNAEARQREIEVRKKHNVQEKEALRTGQKSKPYYLKDADVKRLAKEERLQSMGKKARDKAEKRRIKREKTKESRDMPRVRRER